MPLSRRQEEHLQTLLSACRSLSTTLRPRSIFVTGSGGKTHLLQAFAHELGDSCLCAHAKFEEVNLEPFETMRDYLSAIVERMLPDKQLWQERLREQMTESELFLLQSTLMPNLSGILEDDRQGYRREPSSLVVGLPSTNEESEDPCCLFAFEYWRRDYGPIRIRVAVRDFLRAVSRYVVLVMILDDVHWARSASWDMLEAIIRDSSPRRFLLVGSYSTPLPPSSPQPKLLKQQTTLSLRKFDLDDTIYVLESLLRRKDVTELGTAIFRHTDGSVNCTGSVLRRLKDEKVLYKDGDDWHWNHEAVVNRLRDLQPMPESARPPARHDNLLTIAACLGRTGFDLQMIYHACNEEGPFFSMTEIKAAAESALKEGIITRDGTGFRFSHDNERLAAYRNIRDPMEWHLRIGRQLRVWVHDFAESGQSLPDHVFLQCAHQMILSKDYIEDEWERLDVAEVSAQVADVALRKQNYRYARQLLSTAISMLGSKPWGQYESQMLEWALPLARLHTVVGEFDAGFNDAAEIRRHARRREVVHGAFETQIQCLLYQQKISEASALLSRAVEDLGVSFRQRKAVLNPKKLRQMALDFVEQPGRLSPAKDGSKLLLSRYVEMIATLFPDEYVASSDLYVRLLHEVISMSFGGEILPCSPLAFVCWAAKCASQGDVASASAFGRVAMHFAQCGTDERLNHLTTMLFRSRVSHWDALLRDGLLEIAHSVERLWEYGATDEALLGSTFCSQVAFEAGLHLGHLLKDCEVYAELRQDYGLQKDSGVLPCLSQVIANLTGVSDHTMKLVGDFFNEDTMLQEWTAQGATWKIQCMNVMRMQTAYIYGNYKTAKDIAQSINEKTFHCSDPLAVSHVFFKGMSYLSYAKTTNKGKYRRFAKPFVRQMRDWHQSGVINCRHLVDLMEAESLAASGADSMKARSAFEKAIGSAAKDDFVQHQAMASELAAVYGFQTSSPWATTYLEQARTFYGQWGAAGKVRDMDSAYSHHFQGSTIEMTMSGLFASRSSYRPSRTMSNDFFRRSVLSKIEAIEEIHEFHDSMPLAS